jgi:hypothetical protein
MTGTESVPVTFYYKHTNCNKLFGGKAMQSNPSSKSKSPTEILELQLEILKKIYELQEKQNIQPGQLPLEKKVNEGTENFKWEYQVEFIRADTEIQNIKEYLIAKFPKWKSIPQHTPLAMLLRLNGLGENGWELVHMEPISSLGAKEDIGYPITGVIAMAGYIYSHTYFCVFKRKIK